jgi:2-polyprenyl-6-methoxyphenol hydroxylase-like FAD-dependent oxidoreductase
MKILISGAGIAGTTFAYWLRHHGFEPTIVEAAPKLRTGGYIIDFWGAGFDIAERMGLVPNIMGRGYRVREVRVVNDRGRRIAGFPVDAFTQIARGRYTSLARGDLAASIFGTIAGNVEVIFGDGVDCIEPTESSLRVSFKRGSVRDFDLVVGADGLHSRIRQLAFGPQSRFEKYLGYKVAAFEVAGYQPRDELAYVMYTRVSQQVGRFSMRDDRTMFLFIFTDENPELPGDLPEQKALLRKKFENSGWECRRILDALDSVKRLYLDRVSQIRMDPPPGLWSRGRVALVGDAAFCISLLGGQGSALAMVAAYLLAGELRGTNADYVSAFARYQDLFGPFVRQKQDAALRFAGAFAPKSKFALFLRNQIFNALSIRWIAHLAMGHDFADRITLPDYD